MENEFKDSVWIGKTKCADCGKDLDMTSGAINQIPRGVDISVCIGCGGIMVFVDSMTLRGATAEEQQTLQKQVEAESPEVWKTVMRIRKLYLARRSSQVN